MKDFHHFTIVTFGLLLLTIFIVPRPLIFASQLSAPAFNVTLSSGSTSGDVTALQQILTHLGFYSGPITGHFGLLTAIAVEKFQTAHRISANGIVGPLTRKVLNSLDPAPVAIGKAAATPTPTAQSFVTQSDLDAQLNALRSFVVSSVGSLSSGSGGPIQNVYQEISNSQKIDQLTNTTITNPTITGGSLSGVSVSAASLSSSGSLSAGTTTLTSLTVTGSATIPTLLSTKATTTALAILGITSSLLKTDSNGNVLPAIAGVDYALGSSIIGQGWAITNGYLAPTTTIGILVSASSTVGNGTQTGGLTISGGATTTGIAYFAGNVGIGTTSPANALAVNGTGYFTGNVALADTISSSVGSVTVGGTTFLSDYPGTLGTNGNVWVGGAGNFSLTAQKSVGIGYQALAADTSGGTNVAVGYQTMNANTTGSGNTVVGYYSLHSNTVGTGNTIVGNDAAEKMTSSYNTCVGQECLLLTTSGASNTAMGWTAMQDNTTGLNTIAIGESALNTAKVAAGDTIIGTEAAQYATEVNNNDSNTAIGLHALYQATNNSYNMCLGRASCYNLTTGIGNINIGGFEATMLVPPDGFTATVASGAGLSVGAYAYKIAWTLNGLNTELSQSLNVNVTTTSGNQQVTLASLPAYSGPLTCTQTLIYRTKVGFILGNQRWYLADTIGNCSGGSFTDATPDSSLVTEDASPNSPCLNCRF